jgi:hypothetical protein
MAGSDLLAVIIGGAIGIAGSIVPHLLTQSRARASARASVRTYVSAILKMEEVRLYHRRDGKVFKENDDLLAATRYAVMMLRFAETTQPLRRRERRPNHGEHSWMSA